MQLATDEVASALATLGVEHGDRVGIWSTNNAEWIITQLATPKIGAVLVNTNPAFRSSELDFVLRQSGVSVLITLDRYKRGRRCARGRPSFRRGIARTRRARSNYWVWAKSPRRSPALLRSWTTNRPTA
jgi:acyl-CoA synthetase (AMP-forming)/AMP-acid ligase II